MKRLCMGCMQEYEDDTPYCPHCGFEYNSKPKKSCFMMPGEVLHDRYIAGKSLDMDGYFLTYLGFDYERMERVLIREYYPAAYAKHRGNEALVRINEDKQQTFRETVAAVSAKEKQLITLKQRGCLVNVQDCFEQNGTLYLITEYMEGITLKEYLKTHKTVSTEQATLLIQNLINTMKTVHQAGVLHTNLTPDDVFLIMAPDQDKPDWTNFRITGFGRAVAQNLENYKKERTEPQLSRQYVPIEMFLAAEQPGPWTDVYELAVIFYQMITGVVLQESAARNLKDELLPPSKLGVTISQQAETALMNALNIWKDDRTASMEAFQKELTARQVVRRANRKHVMGLKSRKSPAIKICIGVLAAGALALLIHAAVSNPGPVSKRNYETAAVVPDVVGLSEEQAIRKVKAAGLNLTVNKAVYSLEIPAGFVLYQSPIAGTKVDPAHPGSLLITVSRGSEIEMPDLTGKNRTEAEEILEASGFHMDVVEENNDDVEKDHIISQDPAAGVDTRLETIVTVHVSKGPEVIILPDVVGMNREQAVEQLESLGMRVKKQGSYSDGFAPGVVMNQSKQAHTVVHKDESITLTISVGRNPVEESMAKTEPADPGFPAESSIGSVQSEPSIAESKASTIVPNRLVTNTTQAESEVAESHSAQKETETTKSYSAVNTHPTAAVVNHEGLPSTEAPMPATIAPGYHTAIESN